MRRALEKGHNLFDVLQCACLNPVVHYNLPVGLLREGDPADFIVVDNPTSMNVLETWINGERVTSEKTCILEPKTHSLLNNFNATTRHPSEFSVNAQGKMLRVIEAIEGQLVTGSKIVDATVVDGLAVADPEKDLLKITVVNRYTDEPPSVAFIRNFGLKTGAIASTVAHDSHNIIAVGADDESICKAVNLLVECSGGLSVADVNGEMVLSLPIAGLMSDKSCEEVGELYSKIDSRVKQMGCRLRAPYMTLSFMALLVIPSIKLSDKGLFDGEKFAFTDMWAD